MRHTSFYAVPASIGIVFISILSSLALANSMLAFLSRQEPRIESVVGRTVEKGHRVLFEKRRSPRQLGIVPRGLSLPPTPQTRQLPVL